MCKGSRPKLSIKTMLRNIHFMLDHAREIRWIHEVISEMALELKVKNQ
jgi:hypothetical protein